MGADLSSSIGEKKFCRGGGGDVILPHRRGYLSTCVGGVWVGDIFLMYSNERKSNYAK